MREAIIKISPDGSEIEIEGKTFQGQECEVLERLRNVAGETVEEKKLPEYYQEPKQRVKI